jgi:hypothetical protein
VQDQLDAAAENPQVDAQAFLQAFYTAQRGRLEAQVLLGKRRKDKHDRGGPGMRQPG